MGDDESFIEGRAQGHSQTGSCSDRSGPAGSTQSPPHRVYPTAAAISGASPMVSLKRKRSIDGDYHPDHGFSIVPDDDEDIDIVSALTSNRATQLDEGTDEELDEFIHDAIVKRNVKGGTHLLKKIKRKGMGKGDVGGGSFQSMGRYYSPASSVLPHTCQVSIRSCFVH